MQYSAFDRFATLLQEANEQYNLTRITDIDNIYIRHFADSLEALPIIGSEEPIKLLDMGSGAGLPGLALALARPDWHITSLEATEKKLKFQHEVITELNCGNVTLCHGRAEDVAYDPQHREHYDIVTARAVSHLRILVELALPLLRVGGRLLAYKGLKSNQELYESQGALSRLHGRVRIINEYTLGELAAKVRIPLAEPDGRFRIIDVEKIETTAPIYPRDYSLIKNTPL